MFTPFQVIPSSGAHPSVFNLCHAEYKKSVNTAFKGFFFVLTCAVTTLLHLIFLNLASDHIFRSARGGKVRKVPKSNFQLFVARLRARHQRHLRVAHVSFSLPSPSPSSLPSASLRLHCSPFISLLPLRRFSSLPSPSL
jgi:hypothetical protein